MRSVHTAHVMPDIRRSFVTILCCHVIRGLKGKDRMYAIVLRYKRPLSEVDKHVDAHRAWLRKNYADGTFLVSGRQRSGTGGRLIRSPMRHLPRVAVVYRHSTR